MKFIKTDDGSYTGWNDQYEEHYHSTTGALEEALRKYFEPLQLQDGAQILDFCFGLGYNSAVAMKNCRDLNITALELDKNIVDAIKLLDYPVEYENTFNYLKLLSSELSVIDNHGNRLDLIIGDATEEIKILKDASMDYVFFDPFSPGKQPEMWSEEVFRNIFRILKTGGKLATYSCAGRVRRNMKAVGFIVVDGPRVGRRSPSTIAIKEDN